MKVGVLQFFSWPDRKVPLASVYAMALERIRIMDETGYDGVWLAEHHFTGYSVCPSVHMMGMVAAERTKRLRIGTGVSLAPFYNPLRLAEEVALLDMLSGGRVNWGAGRGFSRGEYTAFDIPDHESTSRFRETVEIVLKAWTSERLNFKGDYFSYEDVEVLPKPMQQPHPPVWMAAGSDGAISWAASRGFSVLLGPHDSRAMLAQKRKLYGDGLAAAGHVDGGPRSADGAADRARYHARARDAGRPARGGMAGAVLRGAAAQLGAQSHQELRRPRSHRLLHEGGDRAWHARRRGRADPGVG